MKTAEKRDNDRNVTENRIPHKIALATFQKPIIRQNFGKLHTTTPVTQRVE